MNKNNNYRALILAAGRGSRLNQLTSTHPKCMVKAGDRMLLDWQRSALASAGVSQQAIVLGYAREEVPTGDMQVFVNAEWESSNMVYSLLKASAWIAAGPCIISYSDIVYHPDIITRLLEDPHDIVISYDTLWYEQWSARFPDPLKDAESFLCNPEGRLLDIGRKVSDLEEIKGQYMGLLKFTPQGWAQILSVFAELDDQKARKLDMTSLLSLLLTRGIAIYTVPVNGNWFEIDTQQDLQVFESRPWIKDDPR